MSPRTASQDARIDRTATALGSRLRAETTGVLSAVGKLRIPEFVLFFGLIFEGSMFGLPIPFNQVSGSSCSPSPVGRRWTSGGCRCWCRCW